MNQHTLESLARRIDELEARLLAQERAAPHKDWRNVVGMLDDSEVIGQIIEEGRRVREADRQAAAEGHFE